MCSPRTGQAIDQTGGRWIVIGELGDDRDGGSGLPGGEECCFCCNDHRFYSEVDYLLGDEPDRSTGALPLWLPLDRSVWFRTQCRLLDTRLNAVRRKRPFRFREQKCCSKSLVLST
jgi:hypothetical protein